MVTHYLHDVHCSLSIAEAISTEIQKGFNDSDHAILFALEENPFVSMR
jgi:hypothetical protein